MKIQTMPSMKAILKKNTLRFHDAESLMDSLMKDEEDRSLLLTCSMFLTVIPDCFWDTIVQKEKSYFPEPLISVDGLSEDGTSIRSPLFCSWSSSYGPFPS